MRIYILTLIVLGLLLSACTGRSTPEIEATAQAAVTATPTAPPTNTPTLEPTDTSTPEPPTSTPTLTATPQPECKVNVTELNIHEGPDPQFNVIDQTELGMIFESQERTADATWLFGVKLDGQTTGWVLATALTCNYPLSQLPVAEALPPTYTPMPPPTLTAAPTSPSPTDTPLPAPTATPTIELISEHDSAPVSEHDGN